jgi:hypothetical protein
MGEELEYPPFATLYGSDDTVSPRTAYWLWATADYLHDTYRLDPDGLFDLLPPIARPRFEGAWRDRFIQCFATIAERLARGVRDEYSLTNCTGEEMALQIVLRSAEDFQADSLWPEPDVLESLPSHEFDYDFDLMSDVLLKDNDVMRLFDPQLDGIDDPQNDYAADRGMVNLHPSRWFLPFDPDLED